jgi:hypothetical protein
MTLHVHAAKQQHMLCDIEAAALKDASRYPSVNTCTITSTANSFHPGAKG